MCAPFMVYGRYPWEARSHCVHPAYALFTFIQTTDCLNPADRGVLWECLKREKKGVCDPIYSVTLSLLALEECCYLDKKMRVPSDWTRSRRDMICRLTLTYRSEGVCYYSGAEMLIQKLYPVPRTRTCRCDLFRHKRPLWSYHTKCTYSIQTS